MKIQGKFLLFFFAVLFFTISCDVIFPKMTYEEREEAKKFCKNLPHPSDFTQKSTSKLEKWELSMYGFVYTSDLSYDEVKQFYDNLFIKDGWHTKEVKEFSGESFYFSKNKYAIGVYHNKPIFSSKHEYKVVCSYDK